MLILPTGARTTLDRPPVVTCSLILTNFVIFLFCWISGYLKPIIVNLGFIAEPFGLLWFVRLFTGMFLHGDWFHLLGNMIFLWVFGATLEDRLGTARFLALYFLGGISGWLLYGFAGSSHPAVGASGCVSALLGAQLVINPLLEMRILFLFFWLLPPVFFVRNVHVAALIFVPFYFLLEYFFYLLNPSNVAHSAHAGGFIWGLVFSLFIRFLLMPREDTETTVWSLEKPGKSVGAKQGTAASVHPNAAEAGRQAVLQALQLGNNTQVSERYRQFRQQFPGSILAPADQLRVAKILRDLQDMKGAVDAYQRLANSPPNISFRVEAAMALADLYENDLHDYQRAHKTLALILKKFPEYERRNEVERRLHAIGDIIGRDMR